MRERGQERRYDDRDDREPPSGWDPSPRDPWGRDSRGQGGPARESPTRESFPREAGRRGGRPGEPLEQRLDRWVSAGRQFVDGVAGNRPGGRGPARAADPRGSDPRGGGRGAARPGPLALGRWVEERLDWFLEDGDDWREPWEAPPPPEPDRSRGRGSSAGRASPPPAPAPSARRPEAPPAAAVVGRGRRPLEAISRRGLVLPAAAESLAQSRRPAAPGVAPARDPVAPAPPADSRAGDAPGEAWPDDDDFLLPRWRRPAAPPAGGGGAPPSAPAGMPPPPGRPLPRSSRRR